MSLGPYGAYVWSAYAITLVVLVANLWLPLRRVRRLRRTLTDNQIRHADEDPT